LDPFISIADLNNYLGTSIAANDAKAIMALDVACQTVRSYCGQVLNLVRNDVVEYRGFQQLILPELPVVQVNQVLLRDETVEVTDYLVAVGGILKLKAWRSGQPYHSWTTWWDDVVAVDYDHGWAIDEADVHQDESGVADVDRMPSDLRMVALRLATGHYRMNLGGTPGMRSESLGSYSYTRMDGSMGTGELSMGERLMLDKYKVRRVPVG
jgi:hypothetical protein